MFGGLQRNPEREAFVFDAKPCPNNVHNSVIALALSDGSIRLLDSRQRNDSDASTGALLTFSDSALSSSHATSVGSDLYANIRRLLCSMLFHYR